MTLTSYPLSRLKFELLPKLLVLDGLQEEVELPLRKVMEALLLVLDVFAVVRKM